MKKYFFFLTSLLFSTIYGRVVSTSPAITEFIYELGSIDKLVAVSTYCNYPEAVLKLPRIGTPFTPNYELILRLKPSIVLTQSLEEGRFEKRLHELGLKTVGVRLTTYDDILIATKTISATLKVKEESLIKKIKEKELELIGLKKKGTYSLAIGVQEAGNQVKALTLSGDETYLSQVLNFSGLRNKFSELKGYQSISLETISKNLPDFLFLISQNGAEEMEKLKRSLEVIIGKKNSVKYVLISEPAALIPGPRIRLYMEEIKQKLEGFK